MPCGIVERVSGAVDRMYGWTCESVLAPAWDGLVRGRPTHRYLAFLHETERLPPSSIEELQVTKLRQLLSYAGLHVPYYRELFAKLRFDPRGVTRRSDLSELPLLTRDIIRERYNDLLDPAHVSADANLKKGTSGSTGTPLKFEYSKESFAWREATKIRGYGWAGYRLGMPTLHYWAQVYALPSGLGGLKIQVDRALKRDTFLDSMKQDETSMRAAAKLIAKSPPHVIVCYTQSCAQFARFILDQGLRDWPDIPVLCGAEAVLPADRAVLAKAFGPGIFETYGSRETMLMASECEAHDGMHLSEENLFLEIVRDGKAQPPGEIGDVIVTDLHNYGMPFIRYQNGDLATMQAPIESSGYKKHICSCGRGLRKLARVDGRRADTLIDREGKPIPGIIFHVLFSDARQEIIKQFQAVQKIDGEVILRVVRGQDWDEAQFAAIQLRFGEYLRGLPFRVEIVDWIPAAATGKRKTIVVERPGSQAR